MKIKQLEGTFGAGVTWHGATRTLLVSILAWAWSFHFPLIGACKTCGHGWSVHVARRDHKAIQWRCLFKGRGSSCECERYDPIRKEPAAA
jgi:hypothetical protein